MPFLTLTTAWTVYWLAWIGAVAAPPALALAWRRTPRHNRKRLRWRWVIPLAIIYGLGVWAFLIEPELLVVQHVTVTSAQWRGPPLRIGVMSDTHSGAPHMNPARVRRLIARLNAEQPDIVVLLGDYAGGHALDAERSAGNLAEVLDGVAALGEARAPLGIVGVLGNHDWWFGGPRLKVALGQAGVRVLENDAVRIARPDGPFWIAGLASLDSRHTSPQPLKALAAVPAGEPALLIMHEPDAFAKAPPRVAIALAGHTHCGQVRLPFIGPLVAVSTGAKRWNCGLYNEGGRQIYVTGGLGDSVLPVRFLNPPQMAVVTLTGPRP